MSAWLQRQALAPAAERIARRALRRRPGVPHSALIHAPGAPGGQEAAACELARVAGELASLRRDLRRLGLACLVAVFLLCLHDGWPALRWLLLVP